METLFNSIKRIEKAREELTGITLKTIVKSAIAGVLLGVILCAGFVVYLGFIFGWVY